jgi:MFS family permease
MDETRSELTHEYFIPWYMVGITAIICAATLIIIAVLGPIGQGIIQYRTSQSGIWQIAGQDLANLILVAPMLLIGGILCLAKRAGSKYLLILTPITLMYTGISIGIGQEWSNSAYSGNVENYWWLFLILVIGGLILLLGSLSMFTEADAPDFKPRGLRIYVGLMAVFFLLFAAMWISQIIQVTNTGDLADGSYKAAPTAFWTIRYLDLGVSIPLGFLALFLMLSKPRKAYSILLLFFGFFITMGTAVDMMAIVQVVKGDQEVAEGGLIIFPVLTVLSYGGLFYLVKDKIRRSAIRYGKDGRSGEHHC